MFVSPFNVSLLKIHSAVKFYVSFMKFAARSGRRPGPGNRATFSRPAEVFPRVHLRQAEFTVEENEGEGRRGTAEKEVDEKRSVSVAEP